MKTFILDNLTDVEFEAEYVETEVLGTLTTLVKIKAYRETESGRELIGECGMGIL